MQYKKTDLYRKILGIHPSLENEEYVSALLNHVTTGIKEWSRQPTSLILNVKNFGRFHWKKRNLQKDMESKSFFTDPVYKRGDEHKNFVEVASKVLSWYDKYEQDKIVIHKINHGANYKTNEELKAITKQKKDDYKNNPKILI